MKIAKHSVVTMHYTLKNQEGQILDSSEGRQPLVYLHGVGGLIPGLESELNEKTQGDKVKAIIAPADAYGEVRNELYYVVSKSGFQGDEDLFEGMQVQLDTEQGPAIGIVEKIAGEEVTLNLNHPLAGVTLYFDVEVMGVREASQEEISHGHVHGEGGHHH
ncbi:MAG: peptidylprolyl isomerase [Crocinitomicaceae bacterium]|nr:peptidylprolyl isomerase [Crocinitomicaceae bacterium]MBK8927689.1 peptidylprolyl isomerase [Crocinitomicaceae bacterium]